MKTFQDNQGRQWDLELNVDALKRVRGALDVDLLTVMDGGEDSLLERLVADPVLLCDVIFVLCRGQADKQKISDEDFGRAMAGDAIDAATTAFLEELVDFFPKPRRAVLRKGLKKVKKLEAMAMAAATKVLDGKELEKKIQAELDAKMNDLIPPSAGGSSTDSPAPPESNPDR